MKVQPEILMLVSSANTFARAVVRQHGKFCISILPCGTRQISSSLTPLTEVGGKKPREGSLINSIICRMFSQNHFMMDGVESPQPHLKDRCLMYALTSSQVTVSRCYGVNKTQIDYYWKACFRLSNHKVIGRFSIECTENRTCWSIFLLFF